MDNEGFTRILLDNFAKKVEAQDRATEMILAGEGGKTTVLDIEVEDGGGVIYLCAPGKVFIRVSREGAITVWQEEIINDGHRSDEDTE